MIKTHDRGCEQLRLGPLPLCKQNENYCEMEQASLNTLRKSVACSSHTQQAGQPTWNCLCVRNWNMGLTAETGYIAHWRVKCFFYAFFCIHVHSKLRYQPELWNCNCKFHNYAIIHDRFSHCRSDWVRNTHLVNVIQFNNDCSILSLKVHRKGFLASMLTKEWEH